VGASAANLPDPHHGIAVLGSANGVDLNGPSITVIPDFKTAPPTQSLASGFGKHPESPIVEITSEMTAAGEAVLDRALAQAELPASWAVIAAARDVYIAMDAARALPRRAGKARPQAKVAQGADSLIFGHFF
jgi:hypothetical protein